MVQATERTKAIQQDRSQLIGQATLSGGAWVEASSGAQQAECGEDLWAMRRSSHHPINLVYYAEDF